MSIELTSPAVAVARAHVEAWSNHDWERWPYEHPKHGKARQTLAPDVHMTATTTQPVMKATDLTGVDDYMQGLKEFTEAVVPGSLEVNGTLGDERNALLMVTVQAALGPGGAKVTLPAARLYLLDENGKIKAEQVVFFVAQD